MSDPFASSTLSLILAWFFAAPLLYGFVGAVLKAIFGKEREVSWAVSAWLAFCILVLSPFRYLVLQMIMVATFPWQSWSALGTAFGVALYIWVFLAILYFAGVGLPLFVLKIVAGPETKDRLGLAMAAFPFSCMVGYALFFAILPYTAWSVHWLKDHDVVKSTNGPANLFYSAVVRPDIPRIGPQLSDYLIPTSNSKAELRNHVLKLYVNPSQQARRSILETRMRIEYAHSILTRDGKPIESISTEDMGRVVAAYRSALEEARSADVAELNLLHPGLGDAWRDKLVPSLEFSVEGWQAPSNWSLFKANGLFAEWANWYNDNVVESVSQDTLATARTP